MGICVMTNPEKTWGGLGCNQPTERACREKADAKLCVPTRLARRAAKVQGRRPRSHGPLQPEKSEKINRLHVPGSGACCGLDGASSRGEARALAGLGRDDVGATSNQTPTSPQRSVAYRETSK